MCFLTICRGHAGIEAAKPENPERAVFVPLSLQGPATASCLHVKASSSVWEQLDPDLVLSYDEIPKTLEFACLPQGTQPQDIGIPDPLS